MTKQDTLQKVFYSLRSNGIVRDLKDFATKIGYNYSCTSAAINGEERYLNDRFFSRIIRAFPQVSVDFIRTGQGPVLIEDIVNDTPSTGINPINLPTPSHEKTIITDTDRLLTALTEQQELTRRQQLQTEKALEQIDKLIDIIRSMSASL